MAKGKKAQKASAPSPSPAVGAFFFVLAVIVAVGAFFFVAVVQGGQEGGGDVGLIEDKLFNGTDEPLDFKGYGRTNEQKVCKQLVWPTLTKYIEFHKKQLDFSNELKNRRFLIVTGFGEQVSVLTILAFRSLACVILGPG
jgi:hypothetical protein